MGEGAGIQKQGRCLIAFPQPQSRAAAPPRRRFGTPSLMERTMDMYLLRGYTLHVDHISPDCSQVKGFKDDYSDICQSIR